MHIRMFGGKSVDNSSEDVLVCGIVWFCDIQHLGPSKGTKHKYVTLEWISKCIENRVVLKDMHIQSL